MSAPVVAVYGGPAEPSAMLEDRQPSMVHSASRAGEERTVHKLWMTRGALEFLPSQQHFNAMVRCPHAHHNLRWGRCGADVATLTAYSCLYFVRSDAVQRIPTQSSSSANRQALTAHLAHR